MIFGAIVTIVLGVLIFAVARGVSRGGEANPTTGAGSGCLAVVGMLLMGAGAILLLGSLFFAWSVSGIGR
jgi:hypothetical protein